MVIVFGFNDSDFSTVQIGGSSGTRLKMDDGNLCQINLHHISRRLFLLVDQYSRVRIEQ